MIPWLPWMLSRRIRGPSILITRITYRPGKPNGVALARMIRVKRPGMKIIFLARPENEAHTEGLGVFLRSPLDEDALVATVGRLLGEQAIGEAAYFIWEQEGRPDGRAEEHWQRAVAEIHGIRSGETQGGDEDAYRDFWLKRST